MLNLDELHDFILAAKAATYVGDGQSAPSCRPESHDLAYQAGDFRYLDSYFGGSDFIGQEIVYHQGSPVWGMNYYGVLMEPEVITADEQYELRENYYLQGVMEDYPAFFLKVVVEFGGVDGKVITAFDVDRPKPTERIIWSPEC